MKTVLGIIAAVFIVGAIGGFVVMDKDDSSSNTSNQTSQSNDMNSMDMSNTQQQPANESDNTSTNNIVMKNIDFSPDNITVKKGTTVTWTNEDDVQHDVSPDKPTDEFKKSALFGKGGTYSVTFNTPGTYTYKCTPHPFMKGTIVVTE